MCPLFANRGAVIEFITGLKPRTTDYYAMGLVNRFKIALNPQMATVGFSGASFGNILAI